MQIGKQFSLNLKLQKLKFRFFRVLCDLQASNGSSLSDIQNEISDGANLIQIVGNLTQMINKELNRAR